MAALDGAFAALVQANPQLRPRVGNPDELRSNRMGQTLDLLKHRVFTPEPGLAEAVDGAVITALNEEAVVSAALGNKGGINLVVSYEAFAVKMLGALRQEILFARHQAQAGTPPGWLSVVTVATSHTWENGKNEQSHQDPTLAEALLGEMSDTSRVLFPVDANSAVAALRAAYASHGQFWTLVVPKRAVASQLSAEQAERLVDQGGWVVKPCDAPDVLLVAIGAYQLQQALLAARRLEAAGHRTAVTCVIEPGNVSGKGCAVAPAVANRKYLESGVTGTDSNGVAGFAGNFNLWLRAPGSGNAGTIRVDALVPSWLQFNWTGTVGNPSARATFGVYRSGPIIHRREMY